MGGDGILIRGMYRDIITGANGRVIFDSGWHANTIVRNCRVLIAGFMKNDAPSGIQSLMVGEGLDQWDSQWNTSSPPGPAPESAEHLETPYAPPLTLTHVAGQGYLEIDYLDDQDKPVASGVTNRLQVKAILEPGYPVPTEFNTYPLREFGLFGRFGGEDYMINCVRHPVIYKDASATLAREIKLYF